MRGSSVKSSNVEWNWQSNQRVKVPKDRGVGHIVRSSHQPSSSSSKIVGKTVCRAARSSSASPHSGTKIDRGFPTEIRQGQGDTRRVGGLKPVQERGFGANDDR